MNEKQYKIRANKIYGIMSQEGWKEFLQHIKDEKEKIYEKMKHAESCIEVADVAVKTKNITIVMLNKDSLQHELALWTKLEQQINDWAMVALKE